MASRFAAFPRFSSRPPLSSSSLQPTPLGRCFKAPYSRLRAITLPVKPTPNTKISLCRPRNVFTDAPQNSRGSIAISSDAKTERDDSGAVDESLGAWTSLGVDARLARTMIESGLITPMGVQTEVNILSVNQSAFL